MRLPSPITVLSRTVANPLFSNCCKLFVVAKNLNSFAIKQIQTLPTKHPGYGCPGSSQSAPLPNVTRRPVDSSSSLDFNPGRGLLRYRSLTVICQLSQVLSLVAAVPSN